MLRMGCSDAIADAVRNPVGIVQFPYHFPYIPRDLLGTVLDDINKTEIMLRSSGTIKNGEIIIKAPHKEYIESVSLDIDGTIESSWWKTWAQRDEFECLQVTAQRLKEYQERDFEAFLYR